jgi:hypothetical protein
MAQVITFERFAPIRRFDGIPWTTARIEEAPYSTGPWTPIDTKTLSPVDDDPSEPIPRSLTTELASDAPALWYRIVFEDGTGDETEPTDPIQNIDPPHLYVTADELKQTMEIGDTALDAEIDLACESASRLCDAYKGTRYYSTTETRLYTGLWGGTTLGLDAVNSVTLVEVDRSGTGSYDETWVEGSQFVLEPANAALEGTPYSSLRLLRQSGTSFPGYVGSIRVTGSFGWADPPAMVRKAATMLATRLVKRRETPYAMVILAGDTMSSARLPRIDPDVALMLDAVPPIKQQLISVSLG